MQPLPPVDPAIGLNHRVRLGRDYYVRVDTLDYSVDPPIIGRFVDVIVSPQEVTVFCDGQVSPATTGPCAKQAAGTDPAHADTAQQMRQALAADGTDVRLPPATTPSCCGHCRTTTHHPPRRRRPGRADRREWTEQRRRIDIELPTKARLTLVDTDTGRSGRTSHSGDRRVTSTRIFPVIVFYTITASMA
jgi:hypothetical protein